MVNIRSWPLVLHNFLLQLVVPPIKYFRSAFIRARILSLDCQCASSAVIQVDEWCNFKLEPKVSIGHGALVIVSDEKSTNGVISSLHIGMGTSINEYANIRAAGGIISIGRNCLIAQFVTIVASNHSVDIDGDMIEQKWSGINNGISIGNNTWIGAGCTILPGVAIGNGCVIGAGSVVSHDVADNQIVAGVPAKLLRVRAF